MTPLPDVLVAGGGIIGSACACVLARSGRRVHLIERGGTGGEAWRASAGVLAAQLEAFEDQDELNAGVAGRQFYWEQGAALEEQTGISIQLTRSGVLRVAEGPEDAARIQRQVEWQRQAGQQAEWLTGDALRRRWPWLAPAQGALLAPDDGSVNPARVVEALRAEAIRAGAKLLNDEVVGLIREDSRITGVAGRERHSGGTVVLAAGAWTTRLAGLPAPLPVEPVRGELVAYPWPQGADPAIVFGWGGYLLERDGEAIAGSTMDYAGFDAGVSPMGLRTVRAQAERLAPGFRSQTPARHWAGLRPVSPDGRPIVGPDPQLAGLWYATGHGRNGVLFAGATAGVIRDRLDGHPGPSWAAAWIPTRFAR